MQTWWDSIQQILRIALYHGAAALVALGILEESAIPAIVGAGMTIATGLWTFYWNKRTATVPGLQAAGTFKAAEAATAVEEVIQAKGG